MSLELSNAANLATFQAASGFPRRMSSGLAVCGDSRTIAMFVDGTGGLYYPDNGIHVKTASSIFTWASALGGASLAVRGNYGKSGDRSDQYLTRLPNAIATGASIIGIFGVVNDIGQSGTTGDTAATMFARVKAAALTILAAGKTPLLFTEPGATTWTGSLYGMLMQFNQMLLEFAEQTPGILLFDLAGLVWDQTSTSFAFKSGYSADGTHYTAYGAAIMGIALKAFLAPYLPAAPEVVASSAYMASNGNIAQLTNPLFLTTTGGTNSTGITGTTPAGFTSFCSGSTTATASVAAAPDGIGNAVTFAITGAAAGDNVRLNQTAAFADFVTGDIVDFGMKAVINSGAQNLRHVALWGNVGGESNPMSDLYNSGGVALPSALNGLKLTQRSVSYGLKSGFAWVDWSVRIELAAAGTANVTVWCPMLRRRYAA